MSRRLSKAAAGAGLEALRSGWLTMGPRTEQLEAELAERHRVAHVVATSSGTAALHLSCIALGAGPGAEMLVPALGPRSCLGAPAAAGARTLVYDVDAIEPDPEAILARAGGDCRAVLARHPLGFAADLAPLAAACKERGLALIEDCREALGAETAAADPVGRSGSVGILSFAAGRQVPANEGGAVLTDDEGVATRIRSLRSHAMTSGTWDRHRGHAETYDVVDVGFNYRIDEVRAAIAQAGLAELEATVAELRERAAALADLGELPVGAELERSSPLALPLLAAEPAGLGELRAAIEAAGAKAIAVDPLRGGGEGTPAADALAARMLLALPG